MGFYNVLEIAGNNSGHSMREVSLTMGRAHNHIAAAKSRGSVPTVDNAARMLEVCGYGLYALPIADAPKDALRITPNDQDATNG